MQRDLNRYRFLFIPAIVLAAGLMWAFIADPAISYLTAHLDPERQDRLRRVNDVVVILITSMILAIRIRRQQATLVRSEEEYRRLFEANPSPMWIYDCQTLRFLSVNHAAKEKYGYSHERFLKMTIYDIRPQDARSSLGAFIKQEKEQLVHAGIWQHANNKGEIFEVSITSHTVEWGGRSCKLVMVTDVTTLLKQEKQLKYAYQKLKSSNEKLLRVAWSNSHELRKPLCSVIALSDLLDKNIVEGENREIVNHLRSASLELDAIVKANGDELETEEAELEVCP